MTTAPLLRVVKQRTRPLPQFVPVNNQSWYINQGEPRPEPIDTKARGRQENSYDDYGWPGHWGPMPPSDTKPKSIPAGHPTNYKAPEPWPSADKPIPSDRKPNNPDYPSTQPAPQPVEKPTQPDYLEIL